MTRLNVVFPFLILMVWGKNDDRQRGWLFVSDRVLLCMI